MRQSTPFAIATIIGLAGMAWMFSGCATLTGIITPARVEAVTKLAAYSACRIDTVNNPENRPQWLAAYGAVKVLADSETWDAALLKLALDKTGLDVLNGSPEAELVIADGLLLVDLVTGGKIDLTNAEHARAAIIGVAEGLNLALDHSTPMSAVTRKPSESDQEMHARILAKLMQQAAATRRK